MKGKMKLAVILGIAAALLAAVGLIILLILSY